MTSKKSEVFFCSAIEKRGLSPIFKALLRTALTQGLTARIQQH